MAPCGAADGSRRLPEAALSGYAAGGVERVPLPCACCRPAGRAGVLDGPRCSGAGGTCRRRGEPDDVVPGGTSLGCTCRVPRVCLQRVLDHAPVYPRVLDELVPSALHTIERHANNPVEADHGRLEARLRPDPGRGARLRAGPAPRPLRHRHRDRVHPPAPHRVRRSRRHYLSRLHHGDAPAYQGKA